MIAVIPASCRGVNLNNIALIPAIQEGPSQYCMTEIISCDNDVFARTHMSRELYRGYTIILKIKWRMVLNII
jgi:hypothetical protein